MSTTVRPIKVKRDEAIGELGRWAASFATLVGVDVVRALASFADEAAPGSRIEVTCTRDGFEAQITRPLVAGRSELLSPERVVALARELGEVT